MLAELGDDVFSDEAAEGGEKAGGGMRQAQLEGEDLQEFA